MAKALLLSGTAAPLWTNVSGGDGVGGACGCSCGCGRVELRNPWQRVAKGL